MPEDIKLILPKKAESNLPIERLRGPRPAGWSMSDQMNEDYQVKEKEWFIREEKKGTNRPFPGLSRGNP